jgi:ubiquinone/menaquinone biosynthesis C-methylase UbiE
MKRKLYTKYHNIDLLKEVDNKGGQFTAEEHAYVVEREFANKFESREILLRWYLSENAAKLSSLGFLIRHIYDNRFTNILSLGAGTCVLEYLLKLALSEEAKVVGADFDSYFIDKAKILLPGIIPVKFNLFKDDVGQLKAISDIDFDIAVFYSSSYVMDDALFVKVFQRLKEVGVKQIIDFQAGYIKNPTLVRLYELLSYILSLPPVTLAVRKLFGKYRLREAYSGKFHGYSRSRGELRRLYKEAGIPSVRELKVSPYEYVAILNCES